MIAAFAAALWAVAGGAMAGTLEPENLPGMCLTLPAGATEAVLHVEARGSAGG